MPREDTQFKPGQSGNPSGRKKGSKNLFTKIREELAELFEEEGFKERLRKLVQEGNKRDLITVLDRIIAIAPKEPLIKNEHKNIKIYVGRDPRHTDSLRCSQEAETSSRVSEEI